ncbi:hypothetical protein [Synechococcus sp. C9]|uniref:hypothetical protein n=1 Tax=Synechococcus sp. C9 TaxID=102119 RepID=UPI001FF26636|nr:hypothetical protein [Synechococcus sp. C9]
MILVLPLVLLALAAAGGATGIAFGAKGAVDIASAQGKIDEAKKRYEYQRLVTDNAAVLTNRLAQEYGQYQMHVKTITFQRWVQLMQKIRQNVALREMQHLVGIEVVIQEIKRDFGINLNAGNVLTGGATAAGAAFAASQGTIGLVGLFGAASTGTAISSLSGAAAWNATLAALGGGSLAAGGGGMALGAAVLGGITVAPALLIGGFVLAGEGEKALTEAENFIAEVDVEISKLRALVAYFELVKARITELEHLLLTLNIKAIKLMNEIESHLDQNGFSIEKDGHLIQSLLLIIKALADMLRTPILDNEGNLNPLSAQLKIKYRSL